MNPSEITESADGSQASSSRVDTALQPPSRLRSPSTERDAPYRAKRTKTGCLTCRKRRVKCDETPGTCTNCSRMQVICSWPLPRDILGTQSSPSLSNRKTRQLVCQACRAARLKCSQDRPSCRRCASHGISCDYTISPAGIPEIDRGLIASSNVPWSEPDLRLAHTVTSTTIDNMPRQLLDRLISTYFLHVHPSQANAFIHRSTILREIQERSASVRVLLAICAVAAQFLEPEYAVSNEQLGAWAKEAKATLMLHYEMNAESVACALLLARHDIQRGAYGSAWIYTSIACRCAIAIGLQNELPPGHPATRIQRETRRRLMWGCYCLDRMMSGGHPDFTSLRAGSLRIRLPAEEDLFLYGKGPDTPAFAMETPSLEPIVPGDEDSVGILGHYIRMVEIRTMVLRYSRSPERDELSVPPWEPHSPFQQCLRRITVWKDQLPISYQLEPETIISRHSQNQITGLAMIHIWYDQTLSDLYRIALPGFPESLPFHILSEAPPGWVRDAQDICVHHAQQLAATIRLVTRYVDVGPCPVFDPSLPICVFESMRTRLAYLFAVPGHQDSHIQADVDFLGAFVATMPRSFKRTAVILKELDRMMRRHGIFPKRLEIAGYDSPKVAAQALPQVDTSNSSFFDGWNHFLQQDSGMGELDMPGGGLFLLQFGTQIPSSMSSVVMGTLHDWVAFSARESPDPRSRSRSGESEGTPPPSTMAMNAYRGGIVRSEVL